MNGSVLERADLSGADLTRANLNGADIRDADLRGAKLYNAQVDAWLIRSNLSDADLRRADLSWANLSGADLSRASLLQSRLDRTMVDGVDFTNAILGDTSLNSMDLRRIRGLETVLHRGPSSIGIDTLYRSHGDIPESFLRGAGVPEGFITYMKSLTTKAFEFYSAFISYSTKNQEIADRIYADLQAKNVRCWLATEDLKIGDPFRDVIDRSIKLHDKLLLILSDHSVQSPWVQDEVEAALERERKDQRFVLFPIRIDDAVMDTSAAWAALIRRTRHIGDFTRWKDHDAYQTAFERLLRDLQANHR